MSYDRSVTACFHRRVRLVLMVALCAMWAATPLIAEICASAATECHRHMHMPCCPPADGGRSCAPTLCPAQASQRAMQTQPVRNLAKARPVLMPVSLDRPAVAAPLRELTAGLHSATSVFRWKDDLRI